MRKIIEERLVNLAARIISMREKKENSEISDHLFMQIIYLASMRIIEKWTTPVWNWNMTLQKLVIIFDDRIKLDINP